MSELEVGFAEGVPTPETTPVEPSTETPSN